MAIKGLVAGYSSLLLLAGLIVAIHRMPKGCVLPKSKQVEADFKSYESAMAMYKLNAGSYPSIGQGLGALVERPVLAPLPRRWSQVMLKINADPWGRSYVYRFPGGKDPEQFELISKGPDGILDTRDDLNSNSLNP